MTQEFQKNTAPNSPETIARKKMLFSPLSLTDQAYLEYVRKQLQVALDSMPVVEKRVGTLAQQLSKLLTDVEASESQRQVALIEKKNLENEKIDVESQKEIAKKKYEDAVQSHDDENNAALLGVAITGVLTTIATGGLGIPAFLAGVIYGGNKLSQLDEGTLFKPNEDDYKKELSRIEDAFNAEKSTKLARANLKSNQLYSAIQEFQTQRQSIEKQLTIVQTSLSDGRQVERLFGISEALAHCTQQQGSSVVTAYDVGGNQLQRLVEGKATLADLESLVKDTTERTIQSIILKQEESGRNSEEFKATLAVQAFVAHVVIPHLDFFVMQAQQNEQQMQAQTGKPIPLHVNPEDYPVLQRLGQGTYRLDQVSTNLAAEGTTVDSKGEAVPALNFSFLRDPAQGTHQERLHRALTMAQGLGNDASQVFSALGAEIEKKLTEMGMKHQEIEKLTQEIQKGDEKNQSIRERMDEVKFNSASKAKTNQAEDVARTGVGMTAALGIFLAYCGEPHSMALGHLLMTLGSHAGRVAGHNAASDAESRSTDAFLSRLSRQQVDTETLRKLQQAIPAVIEDMKQHADQASILKDQTKMEAIGEAFIAQYVLEFGMDVSNDLADIAKKKGFDGSLDDLLKEFGPQSRLGEAMQNLCYGFADSNDLCVIITASNLLSPPQETHERVLKEYVEKAIKPNINMYCTHASKMDLIYQANLTGLGTHFHIHRQTIRGENDKHTQVLFADSFGVPSGFGDKQTVQGAYDVKNLFQYYMERHGRGKWITNAGVQDGIYGDEMAEKRVSIVPDAEMESHVEVSKAAKGVRQEGPKIGDMFLRICAYDYFFPQSVNSAESSNIMVGNPAAPAAYMMANEVIKGFMERMSFGSIGEYREKVGEKLDNLIAQTFMDFFEELGRKHTTGKIFQAKLDLNEASQSTGRYDRSLDKFSEVITDDALSRFDLFNDIYARNLQKTLAHATEANRALLEAQIAQANAAVQAKQPPKEAKEDSQEEKAPKPEEEKKKPMDFHPSHVIHPTDSERAKLHAEVRNHSFENTNWKLGG